jgi:hypothetical protein
MYDTTIMERMFAADARREIAELRAYRRVVAAMAERLEGAHASGRNGGLVGGQILLPLEGSEGEEAVCALVLRAYEIGRADAADEYA